MYLINIYLSIKKTLVKYLFFNQDNTSKIMRKKLLSFKL